LSVEFPQPIIGDVTIEYDLEFRAFGQSSKAVAESVLIAQPDDSEL